MWKKVNDILPKPDKCGIWSESCVVWGIDENDEGYFYSGNMYNHKLKKWNGICGVSGNYDEKIKATHWMTNDEFYDMVTPNKLVLDSDV